MRTTACLALLLLAPFVTPAHAAESYDSCTGTITSIPVTLTTQGTWCLKSDLATTLTAGDIITVGTNNVTIDCNGFKLGNLGAGASTGTTGIRAVARSAVTIRGCNVRGFRNAIDLSGGGHVIEDNRIEASRNSAIRVTGDYMVIRRNMIIDTGGQNFAPNAIYFFGVVDIRDNIINGVFPVDTAGTPFVTAIYGSLGAHHTIRGNIVRGLTTLGHGGYITGIEVYTGEGDIIDNTFSAVPGALASRAVNCTGADGFVRDNRATGFLLFSEGCPAEVSGNQLRN